MSRSESLHPPAAADLVGGGGTPSELQLKMSRSILEYLCRCGMNAGNHLTEQELVDEFRVSRSPIRGALAYLAERGIVEQRPNRGYFLKVSSHDLGPHELELPETAEDRLLDSIASEWFENKVPRSISEAEFRRRYNLGRLAASRILFKLSEDGIVKRNRGHGWQFEAALNNDATRDESYVFRMAVEPAAIRASTFELDRGLAEMSRRDHEMALQSSPGRSSLRTLSNIDAEFHRLIGVSSRNRFFLAAIERQNALRRVLKYASRSRERVLESCAQHMDILAALDRDDREAAAELMRHHLESAHAIGPWGQSGDAGRTPWLTRPRTAGDGGSTCDPPGA